MDRDRDRDRDRNAERHIERDQRGAKQDAATIYVCTHVERYTQTHRQRQRQRNRQRRTYTHRERPKGSKAGSLRCNVRTRAASSIFEGGHAVSIDLEFKIKTMTFSSASSRTSLR